MILQYRHRNYANLIPITDERTLKVLAAAGKIIYPVDEGYKYVNDVPEIGDSFEYKGKNYRLQYYDGCFYPYLHIETDKQG